MFEGVGERMGRMGESLTGFGRVMGLVLAWRWGIFV